MKKHFLLKLLGTIMILAIALTAFAACDDAGVNVKVTFMLDEQEVYKVVDLESGDAVKLPEDPKKEDCVFDGWYLDKDVWKKPFDGKLEDTSVIKIVVYAKWSDSDIKIIEFGSYPQTEVKDSKTIEALNASAGDLPTSSESNGWVNYRYEMWYKEVFYGGEKYRGVYFTDYPREIRAIFSSDDERLLNGYKVDVCYWFKYEPLKWRILAQEGEKAFLLCDDVIDSQAYQCIFDTNNYKESSIRAWLNNDFYNMAFDQDQQMRILDTTVDNSARSTNPNDDATYWNNGVNDYACDNTVDKVFLLSVQEITDSAYGFKYYSQKGGGSDNGCTIKKAINGTDYSRIQGLLQGLASGTSTDYEIGWFLLRSPAPTRDCGLNIAVYFTEGFDFVSNKDDQRYPGFCFLQGGSREMLECPAFGTLPAMWIDLTPQGQFGLNGLEYTLNDDGESYSITGIGTCQYTDLIIPDMYNSKPVTKIGVGAFSGCNDLESVTIPDSVTSIGEEAFMSCKNLTSVVISDALTSIGDYTFCECSNLTDITIPDSVTFIGDNAFHGCKGLPKLTLYVMVAGGGLGAKWVSEAGKRFAELYKDTIWGVDRRGKLTVGVKVEPRVFNGVSMDASSKNSTITIYDLTSIGDLSNYVNSGYVLDITDIMTEKFDYRNGTKISVAEKIDDQSKDRFTVNDKYYAAPSAEYYPGMAYNVNLFNERGFYLAASSEGADKFTSATLQQDFYFVQPNSTTGKSCGPDGVMNTSDDGLPSSLYELIALCEKMKTENVSPIDFSGRFQQYSNFMLSGLMASMMGYDRMSGTYNFNGTYEVVTGFTNENLFPGVDGIKKPTTETVTVTEENGYYTTWAVEKYYAEAFLELAMQKGWLGYSCTSNGVSQRDTMRNFVFSGIDGKEEIGMHVDGSFWWNEANIEGYFKDYEEQVGLGVSRPRTIAWMPLPVTFDQSVTADNGLGKGQTFIDMCSSMLVINSNVKGRAEEQAAKAFLQFLCSDSELSKYTSLTSITKSLNYDLTASDYDAMSDYGKRLWNMTREDSENKVVYFMGNNRTFTANSSRFSHGWFTDNAFSVGNSSSYYQYKLVNPSSKLEEIFNIQKITKTTWQAMYQGSKTVTD